MPRKQAVFTNQFPYHVTARVNNREHFPVDLPVAWKLLTNELYLQHILQGARIHAFVAMPNHFHLLLSTDDVPLGDVMRDFMSATTKIFNYEAGRTGHLYGGHYHWSLIRDPLYYAHALKYVFRNPVKAQLCDRVEDYPASTVSGLVGRVALPLKIHRPPGEIDRLIPQDYDSLLEWLNLPHRKEESSTIQRALRRKEFKLPVDPSTRKAELLSPINAL